MDEDGFCSIVGRLNDMIIRGGENVYPREIEEFLFRHPKASDVQVFVVLPPFHRTLRRLRFELR
ncbi:fatty-acyl-CoA synthase [Ruegeria marina]|uniref:Fatty-acyl-CoA synthase n=1 Tax=Ruegeria marina TaxID=639004 RepID=A0A1G7F3Z0_9RHOB|nr:fatty-acyl-CoA synthase [Ruegeria marina]